MRTRQCIDRDWRFELGDDAAASAPEFNDSSWRVLDLPHDWSIEATPHPDNPASSAGGFFPGGIGWYRKEIDVPADLGDRRMILEFDGVYMNSEVWCNGQSLGIRPYGYISFYYDITKYVEAGKVATIAVRVDNAKQKNCRWFSGAGIYRHVWLTTASSVRVDQWGTFITTPEVSKEKATVECKVEVVNDSDADVTINAECGIIRNADGVFESDAHSSQSVSIPALSTQVSGFRFQVSSPHLWSPEEPNLYTLRVELKLNGKVVDVYDTRFGVRTIRFDPDKGFFINERPTKLKGVNEHHDAGCLGAAVPDDVIRRRFRILRDMGCNAIRVAHNPASPAFLDLCDEMGLMVVEDAFDEWKDGKTEFGYGLYWDEWWERDLVDMIKRDRNHPCVVMWSVGNEIREVRGGRPEGIPIMEALRDVCHREDYTRPMTCGCCSTRKTLAAGYGPIMDVVGYNGGGGGCFDYEKDHKKYPEMIIFASEVPHTLQTRGVYRTRTWYRDLAGNPDVERIDVPHFTEEEVFTGFDEHYQSSYDNAMVRISAIDSWRFTRDLPFMCGEFRWTGFDYIGECYAWPAKSWNFGIIDLCGFPKDTYFLCQSEWTNEPMVHLLPHWTWPGLEGKTIPVICYSNCDRVELFLNGESQGVKEMDRNVMYSRWDVPYQPGTLTANGECRVSSGKWEKKAECSHDTSGGPARVDLMCEEASIRSDGTGIAHVVARIVDAAGRFVPYAGNDITFKVEGPARLTGLENGDPIDTTNYKLNHRKAFHGMMLAVVQAGTEQGTIRITATADGLAAGECQVDAK